MTSLLILGTGGHSSVVIESALASGKNILGLFEQKLKIYISKYPMINLLANNYDIIIIDSGRLLIANAKSDLSESFGKGTYLFNPSFSVPFGYDIINLCS